MTTELLTPERVYQILVETQEKGQFPGVGEWGACEYRTPTGARCAVGACLTDEEANNIGGSVTRVCHENPEIREKLLAGGVTMNQWRDLQTAHDGRTGMDKKWDGPGFLAEVRTILGVPCAS